jgi:hypothetical protein
LIHQKNSLLSDREHHLHKTSWIQRGSGRDHRSRYHAISPRDHLRSLLNSLR